MQVCDKVRIERAGLYEHQIDIYQPSSSQPPPLGPLRAHHTNLTRCLSIEKAETTDSAQSAIIAVHNINLLLVSLVWGDDYRLQHA